jgi:hypothetical protein
MEINSETDFNKRLAQALSPFETMLEEKKNILSRDEWIKFIRSLESSFINSPGQYLKGEVPQRHVWQSIVELIFQGIIDDY